MELKASPPQENKDIVAAELSSKLIVTTDPDGEKSLKKKQKKTSALRSRKLFVTTCLFDSLLHIHRLITFELSWTNICHFKC